MAPTRKEARRRAEATRNRTSVAWRLDRLDWSGGLLGLPDAHRLVDLRGRRAGAWHLYDADGCLAAVVVSDRTSHAQPGSRPRTELILGGPVRVSGAGRADS